MKSKRGCTKTGKNVTKMGDLELTMCPLQFVRDHRETFQRLIQHHADYTRGFLPEGGSLADQSALLMDGIDAVSLGVRRVEAHLAEQHKTTPAPGAGNRGKRG